MSAIPPEEAKCIRKRDFFERIENAFALVLIIGLCVEIWDAWESAAAWWQFLITVRGSALVTIGVVGEVYFGSRSGKYAEALRQLSEIKVAEANARAAEAQLELERWKKPRTLPVWKLPQHEALLKSFSGTPYSIMAMPDHEIWLLAAQLRQALVWSGWVRLPPIILVKDDIEIIPEFNGIHVRIDASRRDEFWPAVETVVKIFEAEGIPAEGFATESGTPSNGVHIFIGRRT